MGDKVYGTARWDDDFRDKTAFVTGAASGFGLAIVKALAAEGCSIGLFDVSRDALSETADIVSGLGGTPLVLPGDVRDFSTVNEAISQLVANFGSLDFAVNNAGITGPLALFEDSSLDDARQVVDINLMGVIHCMKAEIPKMLERGSGVIVNTSSVAGFEGWAMGGVYTATKHAVVGLTKTAALELGARGIRVNGIAPSLARTGLTASYLDSGPEFREAALANIPLKRIAETSEIADATLWLLSSRSSFVTGAIVPVDGGYLA